MNLTFITRYFGANKNKTPKLPVIDCEHIEKFALVKVIDKEQEYNYCKKCIKELTKGRNFVEIISII